ncbi:MAG: FAD-binding oxidoreductase [Dehalococcoidia bacterium]|nr:FAD-binding oxidoreductase [Dehalococcoidia bacterium]
MSYSVDDITPSSIERPKTLDEISNALCKATDEGHSVIPWGGGTRIAIGNIPTSYDTALDLSEFLGDIEHEPGDMTVVANAGVTIGSLNTLLGDQGQRLPFEVRDPAAATVGGSVASNASGHRQSSTGGIRDWIIGMQIVLADGTVTKSGGRVVKNVQGYEMHRLHTGAFGTLGVVSQVAFKLLPTPPEQQSVIAWFDNQDTAQDVGMSFVNGLFNPEVISLIHGPIAEQVMIEAGETSATEEVWVLLIRLGGGVRSIERQVNEIVGAAGARGAIGYAVLSDINANVTWTTLEDAEKKSHTIIRMTSRTSNALAASHEIGASNSGGDKRISTVCDLGFGAMTAVANIATDAESSTFINSTVSTIAKHQGTYLIEKCPLDVKYNMDVFSDVGNSIDLMQRIKNQYDPYRTLNPGRFVGKI